MLFCEPRCRGGSLAGVVMYRPHWMRHCVLWQALKWELAIGGNWGQDGLVVMVFDALLKWFSVQSWIVLSLPAGWDGLATLASLVACTYLNSLQVVSHRNVS